MFRTTFALPVLGFIIAVFVRSDPAAAQSLPSYCSPTTGAYECMLPLLTPYTFNHNSCLTSSAFIRRAESDALTDEVDHDWSGSSICDLSTTPGQWHPGGTVWGCAVTIAYPQKDTWGRELQNIREYEFSWTHCQNQTPHSSTSYQITRSRSGVCPKGWESYSGLCRRQGFNPDPPKMMGKSCPSCGNPINPAIANKYQEALDYRGSGPFPLEVRRYYNSGLDIGGGNTFYGAGTVNFGMGSQSYQSGFGDDAGAQIAMNDYESRYVHLALDAIGANWRHSYSRSLHVEKRSNSAGTVYLGSAIAYREDGRAITFVDSNGTWYPEEDIVDRLTELGGGSFRLVTANDEVEIYDDKGLLTSVTHRSGITHTLQYDNCWRLESVTHSFGQQITFSYSDTDCNAFGARYRISAIGLPGGLSLQYTYGSGGVLTSVTYPDTRSNVYEYDGPADKSLTGLIDENGVEFASWGYNSCGFPTSSSHAGGVGAITIAYDSYYDNCSDLTFESATTTDALGTEHKYWFDVIKGISRLKQERKPDSVNNTVAVYQYFGYDANGNRRRYRDFNGRQVCTTYDLARNLEIARVEGLNGSSCPGTAIAGITRHTATQWHPTFRLPTQIVVYAGATATGTPLRKTSYTYDPGGNLLTKTVTDATVTPNVTRTWTYTYDALGRVLTEDGPRTDVADVTTYTYYACATGNECGQLHTITNALEHTTTFDDYNAHGQPVQITDANGTVTTLTYDLRQRLTSRTTGGELTSFEYWPTGLLRKVTLPDGSFVLNAYDDAHRLIRIEDGDGNRIEYTLDAMGNRTAESVYDPSNALARTHTRAINSLNLISREIGAAGTPAVTTVFGYDNNENLTKINAPLSRNTTQVYDELGRLRQITDAANGNTLFGYNASNELTSVTDPRGKITSYQYNGFGDLKQLTSSDTGVAVSTYDSAGNLATRTDARSKTGTFAYDALNRATSIAYPDQTLSFTYDTGSNGIGRLRGASDANHSLAFTYDALGRVIGKTQTVGSVTQSVLYGYTDGNLTTLVTPSGQTVSYAYANGRVIGITLNGSMAILRDVLYEPFGAVAGWTWGNGTIAARVHDLDGKPSALESAGAYAYAYDDAFRITGITDLADATKSWTYGYDVLDRLNAANKTGQAIGYTYDANGNRLTQTGTQTATYSISSTSNRINSIAGTPARTYTYDAAGNVTSDATRAFTYSDAGRLISTTTGGVTTSYVHNAFGERVRKSTASTTTLFVHDEAGHLLGEYDATGALIQETLWLDDVPVATLRPAGIGVAVFYVHTDHLNTPRRITRPSDNAFLWRWDSDPFGTTAANEDPDGDSVSFSYNLRFPGQYHDAETGLSYNYFRDYDPAIGKYVQSDPIGLRGGINTYAYVEGSPLSRIDVLGLIDLGIPGATGETSVHANPGPEAVPHPSPGSRVEHLPAHVHLGNNAGPRVRTDTFEPFSEGDARKMTKNQKKFCKQLSDEIKELIRGRQMSVFKYGKIMAILAAMSPVGLDSVTAACKQDPFWCAEYAPHVFDELTEQFCRNGQCSK